MNAKIAEHAGIGRLKTLVMENTKNKEELIEELEGILKANKDNIYCDEYQIADMIRKALKTKRVNPASKRVRALNK